MDQALETIAKKEGEVTPLPVQVRRRYSSIGLDLGTAQVKLIQLKREKRNIALHQLGIYGLPEGAVTAGGITEPDLLAGRIAWILKRRRFHKNRVNLCIGGQAVILRHVQLPKMAPREIPVALRFEAEKKIMIPLEEAVMDYVILGEQLVDGNELLDIAVVAAPKDVVNDYLQVVLGAGLYPDVIEIESFALQRVLPYFWSTYAGHEKEALMILDIGGESSNLVVIEQGSFSFARTLNIGVNRFCEQIAEMREVSVDAARRLLFGSDPFTVEGVQEAADELVTQIRRSLEFYLYNVEHGSKEIKTLFLCGGGSSIDRLPSFLGFELKVEPKVLSPFEFVQSGSRFIQKDLVREGHMLNIATGLALRGWVR